MSPPEELPPSLAIRYRAESLLGEGGFGRVVRATDLRVGRVVAIKLLHSRHQDPAIRARFEREARLAAALRHPGVVEVIDLGHAEDGTAYVVYEFVDGVPIHERAPDLEPGELLRVLAVVGEALDLAHAAGIVHRDVKPENILHRRLGGAVLCDFGIAHLEAGETVVTAEGLVLGTPAYLAPELWEGLLPSPASDQFAFAATLLELHTGSLVYGTHLPGEVLARLRAGWRFRPPRGLPSPLARVLLRALARDPEARYPSCSELMRSLLAPGPAPAASTRMLDAPPTRLPHATPAPGARHGARPRRRLPRGLLLVAGLAGGVLLARDRAPRPLPAEPPGAPRPASGGSPASPPDPRDLELAFEHFAELLRPGRAVAGLPSGAGIPTFLPVTMGDRLPGAWEDLLEALGDWTAAARDSPVSPARESPAILQSSLLLATDYLHHLWEVRGRASRPLDVQATIPREARGAVLRRVAALRLRAEEAFGRMLAVFPDAPADLRTRLATAALLAGPADPEGVLRTAVDSAAALPGGPRPAWTGTVQNLFHVMRRLRHSTEIRCQVMLGAWLDLLRTQATPAAAAAWGRAPPHVQLLLAILHGLFERGQVCPSPLPPGTEAALVLACDRIEHEIFGEDFRPTAFERGQLHEVVRDLLAMRGWGPATPELFERLGPLLEALLADPPTGPPPPPLGPAPPPADDGMQGG